jgi:hypothetical protein
MAFGSKQELIDELTAQNDALTLANAELTRQLEDGQSVGRIAVMAEQELASATTSVAFRDQAESLALVAVTAAERKRLTTKLSDEMVETRYEEFAAGIRIAEGPAIRAGLIELFTADGTFDSIDAAAKTDATAVIQKEVLDEARAQAEAKYEDPEEAAILKAAIAEKLAGNGDVEAIELAQRARLEEEWEAEVRDSETARVIAEIEATKPDFVAKRTTELRETKKMKDLATRTRNQLEETWADATATAVAEAIGDEQLKELLHKKAEMERDKIEGELKSQELLRAFEGTGIDIASIPEGAEVKIYLGDYKDFKMKERIQGYDKEVVKRGISLRRNITLCAKGDGRFTLDYDSLLDSDNAYVRKCGIHKGTVIRIGRKVTENHETTLESKLKAGVALYIDEDVSDSTITDELYPIANVKINGVSARTVDHIERV